MHGYDLVAARTEQYAPPPFRPLLMARYSTTTGYLTNTFTVTSGRLALGCAKGKVRQPGRSTAVSPAAAAAAGLSNAKHACTRTLFLIDTVGALLTTQRDRLDGRMVVLVSIGKQPRTHENHGENTNAFQ
jgi:hypothetical protein